MSTSSLTLAAVRSGVWQRAADYVELAKPRIVAMELATVAATAIACWGELPPVTRLAWALAGTALVAAGASALNQWLERSRDRLMPRTASRPVAAGRLPSWEAVVWGIVSTLAGMTVLAWRVAPLAAGWAGLAWLLYVAAYTPLKTRTAWNTVVGAAAGALPLLIGWAAADGRQALLAATAAAVLFIWQFPHFMAIAWLYRADYAAAGMKMVSVVEPTGKLAGRLAVAGAWLLVPLGVLPTALGWLGTPAWAWFPVVLGLAQAWAAGRFATRKDQSSARMLMVCSLIYLPAWLAWLAMAFA